VSRAFAQRFWGETDPLGRRVKRGDRWLTVIGVVGDVRDVNVVDAPQPTLYLSWTQSNTANPTITLVARTEGDPVRISDEVRAIVRTVDPAAALGAIRPLAQFLDASLAPQRFRTTLLAALGTVGLLLGALGVGASTARAVQERTPELGIRLALGGARGALWRGAMLRPLRPVGAGVALGVPAALVAARVLRSVLPGTSDVDVLALTAAVGALLLAALAAAAFPAGRIFRVDPCEVLRQS
jgi:predicted lysophospholipase L1 biosynthesis ABC-type transport system permease subunit